MHYVKLKSNIKKYLAKYHNRVFNSTINLLIYFRQYGPILMEGKIYTNKNREKKSVTTPSL
jgi:hypothetical protein